MQHEGREFAARDLSHTANDEHATFSLDIAGAYPEAAAVKRYTRHYRLDRSGPLTIADDYELSEAREPIVWNFMTLCSPEIIGDGQVRLSTLEGEVAQLTFGENEYEVVSEKVTLEDAALQKVWGAQVYRLQLKLKQQELAARHEFTLTIDN